MFAISNKSDYGLLLVSRLSDKTDFISLSRLIEETRLPERFVARIASELVKGGILESREGKIGGYRLAKKLDTIPLSEFFKLFEDTEMVKCLGPDYTCKYENICGHHSFFRGKLQSLLWKELDKWSLADIIKQ